MVDEHDFSGMWECRYWYPSNQHDGEDVSEYVATVHQRGNTLILQSHPNPQKAYMFARMVVVDDEVTGNWHENTSPYGEFAGAMYAGAFYLLLNKDHTRMEGKWVGIGQDDGVKQIYSGRWEIVRRDGKKTT